MICPSEDIRQCLDAVLVVISWCVWRYASTEIQQVDTRDFAKDPTVHKTYTEKKEKYSAQSVNSAAVEKPCPRITLGLLLADNS